MTFAPQPGDCVMLNSGGPAMTVSHTVGNYVHAMWLDVIGQPQTASFPLACVKQPSRDEVLYHG